MANTFSFPTQISFGAGMASQIPAYLTKNNLRRPLVVTDKQVSELGFFKRIINSFEQVGLSPLIYNDIRKNPVKQDVVKGKEAYNEDCDSIVGIGGGSALDVSRAIALSINNHRDLFDYDDLTGGSILVDGSIPHFVTVPTTAGTGSEVGRSAVISEDDTKKKRVLFHPSLMASHVFADPELTYELPPDITAATGMDALAHHLEAFLAKGYNPMCDGIALEGLRMIWENLEDAVKHGNKDARSEMMMASLMGAVAFQKGLGIVHSMSHPLSTVLDMHHGLANAVNLPVGLAFNLAVVPERFNYIAKVLGLPKGEDVPMAVTELNAVLDLPANLGECGVHENHISELAELALADFCLPLNPRKASRDDLAELYKKAL